MSREYPVKKNILINFHPGTFWVYCMPHLELFAWRDYGTLKLVFWWILILVFWVSSILSVHYSNENICEADFFRNHWNKTLRKMHEIAFIRGFRINQTPYMLWNDFAWFLVLRAKLAFFLQLTYLETFFPILS